ncbi:hypothetical protein QCA50_020340 [Cerrena zonata]|uniref:Uncharacterized protein n=1 Tax=Cerrena zonata TaxID=2478898 RepID=A0AAW0F991_9APHY
MVTLVDPLTPHRCFTQTVAHLWPPSVSSANLRSYPHMQTPGFLLFALPPRILHRDISTPSSSYYIPECINFVERQLLSRCPFSERYLLVIAASILVLYPLAYVLYALLTLTRDQSRECPLNVLEQWTAHIL